jgi:formate dehydrogenase iron-sulfur subunit
MLYDSLKCIGCRACQNACKEWNDRPADPHGYEDIYDNPPGLSADTWTIIKAKETTAASAGEHVQFCRYLCMHCTEASCEAVCPTAAISHRGESVIIDQEWCIGCGYCVLACPYDVPHKDHNHGTGTGTSKKCTFCMDRRALGMGPACAEACPVEAIQYGDRADLLAAGKDRVEELRASGYRNAVLYGEKELGGLHSLFVLPDRPSAFGFPEEPVLATSNAWAEWLSGIVTAGVLTVVPFWLLFRRNSGANQRIVQRSGAGEKEE